MTGQRMIKKIYTDHYTLLLDKKDKVLMAMGSDEWKDKYKPAPGLVYYEKYATWARNGWLAKPCRTYKEKKDDR